MQREKIMIKETFKKILNFQIQKKIKSKIKELIISSLHIRMNLIKYIHKMKIIMLSKIIPLINLPTLTINKVNHNIKICNKINI